MSRKSFLLSILFMLSWILIFPMQGTAWITNESQPYAPEESLLEEAFSESGCEFLHLYVNGWSILNNEYTSLEKLEKIANEAANFFELAGGYDLQTNEKNGLRQVSLEGSSLHKGAVNITLNNGRALPGNDEVYETYIVVNIARQDRKTPSWLIKRDVTDFFGQLGVKPNISTTLVGAFPGKLDTKRQENICDTLFKKVNCRITQSIREGGLISKAGYSQDIPRYLKTEAGLVNINVALRYSSYWDKTYLWVGTPVISVEY